jgi:hypothetical protein
VRAGASSKYVIDDRSGLQLLLETLAWMAAEGGAGHSVYRHSVGGSTAGDTHTNARSCRHKKAEYWGIELLRVDPLEKARCGIRRCADESDHDLDGLPGRHALGRLSTTATRATGPLTRDPEMRSLARRQGRDAIQRRHQ